MKNKGLIILLLFLFILIFIPMSFATNIFGSSVINERAGRILNSDVVYASFNTTYNVTECDVYYPPTVLIFNYTNNLSVTPQLADFSYDFTTVSGSYNMNLSCRNVATGESDVYESFLTKINSVDYTWIVNILTILAGLVMIMFLIFIVLSFKAKNISLMKLVGLTILALIMSVGIYIILLLFKVGFY